MIRWLFEILGVAGYLILHPYWAMYLNNTDRARVVVVSGDQVLLVKPWLGMRNWDIPGGGVHGNETLESAGTRELMEETSVSVVPEALTQVDVRTLKFGLIHFTAHYFVAHLDDTQKPNPKFPEVIDAKWFTYDELGSVSLDPQVKKLLSDCLPNR